MSPVAQPTPRWFLSRVMRANAGGELYNAVEIATDREHDSTPSYDRAAMRARVDRLNAVSGGTR